MQEINPDQKATATGRKDVAASSPRVIPHQWITVVNPTNHQKLLQACDHCGVVKSENSVTRQCRAPRSQSLLLSATGRLQSVS